MSAVTCEASSRVAARTRAEGRGSSIVVRSRIGTAKASVLPEPVGDLARTWSPASASGRTSSWIRNGLWIERAASASTTGRDAPSSGKDWCDMLFDSLRVRDLPTSKHPKEEREAHLTGRRDCLPVQQTVAAAVSSGRSRSAARRRSGLSSCSLIPTGEIGRDPGSVKRQHGQLGRRTAHEAVEEQEVFRLGWSKRRIGVLAGETAKRQARADLERCPRSRRKRADGADFAGADEKGPPPARLDRRSDQAEL